jgi:hypothetical protein
MYSYRVSGESAIITATSPILSGNVTIPSTLDGYPVKGIEKEAFNNRTGITYVTMPDSINYIGEYAFSGCKGLKGVTIGNTLFSIYGNAFRGCSSLEIINIPEKVTYIGNQAFYDCTSLKEVSITNLDAWFGIEFGSKDSNPLFYGGGLYLNGELVTCVDVGDGITAIKDYAFAGSSLSEVVIGDSVKTIGFDAFAHCKNLRSVTIGENVITIYPSSFYECSGLSSIEVAPENISYMSVDNVLFTKDGKVLVAYAASKTDDTYVIPRGTQTIGYWAFGYCTSLKKLVIPRSVLSVDESAIWKCSGLTIYCEASQQPDSWYKNWNRENYPVVWGYFIEEPDTSTPTNSDESMYTYYVSNGGAVIKSVDTSISGDVTIPATLGGYPVTTIGQNAFKFCDYMTSVTIPDSVTVISYQAFYGCDNLASINMGNGVQLIGEYAFSYCDSLTSVVIGESVSSIWEKAFAYCKNLTSVIIPISVISIRSQAFEACPKLTIYAEATSKPDGWSNIWNIGGYPVVWGA